MEMGSAADWAAATAAIGAGVAAALSATAAFHMNKRSRVANRAASFSERFRVFELARDSLELVIHNRPEKHQAYQKMREAVHRARFLFPSDVADSLEKMRHDLIDATPIEDIEGGFSDETIATRNKAIKDVLRHHKGISQLFAPHMRVED